MVHCVTGLDSRTFGPGAGSGRREIAMAEVLVRRLGPKPAACLLDSLLKDVFIYSFIYLKSKVTGGWTGAEQPGRAQVLP